MAKLTSSERVSMAMNHKEADRVPFSLGLMLHGAKVSNLSLPEYFSKAENIVRSQLKLQEKYGFDILCAYFFSALEFKAWGGDIIYYKDGPPNAGKPIINEFEDIKSLKVPKIHHSPSLKEILKATRLMKEKVKEEIPIMGVVVSPFSLPIMQLGFGRYIELVYENKDLFNHLMNLNKEFSIAWANAQLEAGANVIAYYDPMSSPSMIPRDLFLDTGFKIAREIIKKVKGDMAIHFASGRTQEIMEDIIETGAVGVGASSLDDLSVVKNKCKNKITVMGNLNGIKMCNWTPQQAEEAVKYAIKQAAAGGGFILSDHHGEIPYQVSDEILASISHAVKKWGKYPLNI
jgi:uroporphyrinogen decarboxylase